METGIQTGVIDPQIDPATGTYIQEMLDVFEPPKVKKDAGKQAKVTTAKQDMKLWQPRQMPMQFDWIPITREKRARERLKLCTVKEVFENEFHVSGHPDLSDRYDRYVVKFSPGSKRWNCSCQGHAYGDTRTLCSHALATILANYTRDEVVGGGPAGPELKRAWQDELVGLEEEIPQENVSGVGITEPATLGITEGLIEIVEQHNQLGLAFSQDPWLMHRLAVYVIDWFPGQKQQGQLQNPQPVHTDPDDPDYISPAERAEQNIPAAEVVDDDWIYQQKVLTRLNNLTECPPPSHWHLPEHFTSLREFQWMALKQIIGAWASGKRFVFVDAPTGAGKSIIANIAFLEWAGIPYGEDKVKGLLIVTSKDLQDQMDGDFGKQWWFAMIKGRLNYPTANFPERFIRGTQDNETLALGMSQAQQDWSTHIDCSDCEYGSKKNCRYCDPANLSPDDKGACLRRCPYRQALWKVIRRPMGMLNTAYLLRSCNSMAWQNFDDRSVLMVDEADTLESVLMGYVTVEIVEKRQEVLGSFVGRPSYKTFGTEAIVDWFGWAGRAKLRIAEIVERRKAQIKGDVQLGGIGALPGEDKIKPTADNRNLRRDLKYWEQLSESLNILMESLQQNEQWVYDGYIVDKETGNESGPIIFKPVRVDKFTHPKLFQHFKKVCFLSATTISADQEARNLGIDPNDYAVISIPREFDPTRCPVYIMPVADNSSKQHNESWPALMQAVRKILEQNVEHRVMIHAVSYTQTNRLFNELRALYPGRNIVTHSRDGMSKKRALQSYGKGPGSVLISPAMARGADFKDDLCRVQIILKVPFPYLGDKQISARLHGTHDGRIWYSMQTVRELVQMTGRNVRSKTDWGINYILDTQFQNLWANWSNLFPEWWRASVCFLRPGEW